jgi:hypothetical protein
MKKKTHAVLYYYDYRGLNGRPRCGSPWRTSRLARIGEKATCERCLKLEAEK